MKNGIGLGTVAGSPAFSREEEGGSSETLSTLNVDPSPPGTEPSVQAVMSLWGREDRWKVARVITRAGREGYYESMEKQVGVK